MLFTHVGNDLGVSWGDRDGTGLVSVEFTFSGETAHSAGAPWRGRSALDAVELMNIGWNYRREHLPLEHRSHYVITNGGDQPNVVPRNASVWYYFRADDVSADQGAVGDRRDHRQGRRDDDQHRAPADACARHRVAAALQQGRRGSDVGQHREGRHARVERGRPDAGEGAAEGARQQSSRGWRSRSAPSCRARSADNRGGGSDDIGDISWNVPTVTLRFPSNIPGLPGAQLGERDRDGDADRAQGRDRRRQGAGDDDARSVAEARARRSGVGLLPERADQGRSSTSRSSAPRTSRRSS